MIEYTRESHCSPPLPAYERGYDRRCFIFPQCFDCNRSFSDQTLLTCLKANTWWILERENQVVKSLPTMLSSQVITDEEELHKMSMECEPPSGGLPPPPPLSTVLASSLPNITPQITLNTTLLHLTFSPRPASETHRPPPPR